MLFLWLVVLLLTCSLELSEAKEESKLQARMLLSRRRLKKLHKANALDVHEILIKLQPRNKDALEKEVLDHLTNPVSEN